MKVGDYLPCYHPLKSFILGYKENNKKITKITSYKVDHLELINNKQWLSVETPISDGVSKQATKICTSFDVIPCGKCIGCRLSYSRSWADRLMLELQYHKYACFLTLTYNPENVPHSEYINPDTGEVLPSLSLKKEDYQLFMKRLRKYLDTNFEGQKIRFFACGEYGDETLRPHYHAIIFGYWPYDAKLRKVSMRGDHYFESETLNKIWGKGFVVVANVEWNCCAYVARYVTKKINGALGDFYIKYGLEPEFALMSRKPGIARQYYEDHPDLYNCDKLYLQTPKGGREISIPHYFDHFEEEANPAFMALIKQRRKELAEARKEVLMSQTDKDYLSLLETMEQEKLAKVKVLERSKVDHGLA